MRPSCPPGLSVCLITVAIIAATMARTLPAAEEGPDYSIRCEEVLRGSYPVLFLQSRAAIIPGQPPTAIITTQETKLRRTHDYCDIYQIVSQDLGRTWSKPRLVPSLKRLDYPDGYERVVGDFWPTWHAASGTVLGTGKTFNFKGGTREDKSHEKVSYSTYDPRQGRWNGLQVMKMPERDHSGSLIREQNAGCTQRVDLPDGDVLLPIRYRRDTSGPRRYVATVARCGFDGKKLVYKKHGTELVLARDRGLCEPSLANFKGKYYLTLRADHTAFVTRSDNGLDYEPIREWTFDDGKPLGSYNTQQHWVTHSDGLFLVYTRRGAGNDHIMRHRAPLFIAQVDPHSKRLCMLRDTERVLVGEDNATLGNFGVTDVSPYETWVVTSEFPRNKRKNDNNKVFVAKILWKTPNRLVPDPKQPARPKTP